MQATMCEWEKKGYKVRAAYVRFIVAWKSKDSPKDEPETAVLLADLLLSLKSKIHNSQSKQIRKTMQIIRKSCNSLSCTILLIAYYLVSLSESFHFLEDNHY